MVFVNRLFWSGREVIQGRKVLSLMLFDLFSSLEIAFVAGKFLWYMRARKSEKRRVFYRGKRQVLKTALKSLAAAKSKLSKSWPEGVDTRRPGR